MTMIHEDRFQHIEYNETAQILYIRRRKATDDLDDEQYRKMLLASTQSSIDTQTPLVLIDNRKFMFTVVPEMQVWIDENVFKPIAEKSVVKKIAVLDSEDIFAEVSVQQAYEENSHATFKVAYFASEDDAVNWLKKP